MDKSLIGCFLTHDLLRQTAASCVKNIRGAQSCNFPTDSCKFPTKQDIMNAQNFNFAIKSAQNKKMDYQILYLRRKIFDRKKNFDRKNLGTIFPATTPLATNRSGLKRQQKYNNKPTPDWTTSSRPSGPCIQYIAVRSTSQLFVIVYFMVDVKTFFLSSICFCSKNLYPAKKR